MAKNKTRLDVALVEKGLAESREKAKAIIMQLVNTGQNARCSIWGRCLPIN